YADRLLPRGEGCGALWGHITAGIAGVDPFDEQILNIGGGCRENPGDPFILADQHERAPPGGPAGGVVLRGSKSGEIQEAWSAEFEMGVVGEQRLATGAVPPIDDPVVGGVNRSDDRRQSLVERVERQPPIDWPQVRQCRRRILRILRIKK